MKKSVIVLATALFLSCLVGCQANTVNPAPEEMAAAILDLTIHDDPSALQELFGYTDPEAVYKDFEGLSQEMDAGFRTFYGGFGSIVGMVPEEIEMPYHCLDPVRPIMLSKLILTEKVSTLEDNSAALIFSVPSYDVEQFGNVSGEFWISSPKLLLSFDPDFIDNNNGQNGYDKSIEAKQLFYNVNYGFQAEILKNMNPTDNMVEFEVVFVPTEMTINGRKQTVWLPEDPEAFGSALVSSMW